MCLKIDKTLHLLLVIALLFGSAIKLSARNKIILSGNKPIACQISVSDEGSMYIIPESIDLKNSTVKLPEYSILQFEGGCFLNGELIGNNSTIIAGRYEIFNNISLLGKWAIDGILVEWFGAIPNNSNCDCSLAINKAISTGVVINSPVLLSSVTYYTKSTIDIPGTGALMGISPSSTIIRFDSELAIGIYIHGQNTTLRNICVREHNMERKGVCIKVGNIQDKVSCTRGYIEDVKAIGGKRGLDLEYQWCNKISGVNCSYNDIGLYANTTTPYIENAIIEDNYQCGVYSEGSGVKLFNVIIEGNKVGCILNGKENFLNNCYFEGNTASSRDKDSVKDEYGFDIEGGHIYAGEQSTIINLIMIGCHISNSYKKNNTVKIDKCLNFTAIGCNSFDYLVITENCNVKSLDKTYSTIDEFGEFSLASRIHPDVSDDNQSVFKCSNFDDVYISDAKVTLDENGYYNVYGNKSYFVLDESGRLLCLQKNKGKSKVIHFCVSDPAVLNSRGDVVLSTTVQYPEDMQYITPSQGLSITGLTKKGKSLTINIGNGFTSINKKIRAGHIISYDVRIKRSYIESLMKKNNIVQLEYITMNNSLIYESTKIVNDLLPGNKFKLVGLSVSLAPGR